MDNVVFLDSDLHEIGYAELTVDFEIGSVRTSVPATNDFEFECADAPDDLGAIYINGTEYGGVVEYKKETTESESITYSGYTWRGLLDKWLICPDDGEDYKTVSGDLNTIIKELLSDVLGGFFTVPDTECGITASTFKFDRYCSVLYGLEKLLAENGARLSIHADKTTAGEAVIVTVEAVEAETLSGTFAEDSQLQMIYTTDGMGINHLICMGSGELAERMRVDLYIDENGDVSETQYYTGFEERQQLYDFSSAESEDDLISYGTSKLKNLASGNTFEISIDDNSESLEIGDIATGLFPNGDYVSQSITKKIVKITPKKTEISYEVEDV